MNNVIIKSNPEVKKVFENYPQVIRGKIEHLRQLILDTANDTESIKAVEETLKWGEPSYLTKHGSTIRIDWKKNKPEQYAMYFKCTSKLVSTFKVIYKNDFNFEGNRAIVFKIDDILPEAQLKKCIASGLIYHKVKHLAFLGL